MSAGRGVAPDEKVCPFCAETIKAAAIKCRYCGSELPAAPDPSGPPAHTPSAPVEAASGDEAAPAEADVPSEDRAPSGPAAASTAVTSEPVTEPDRTAAVKRHWIRRPEPAIVLVLLIALVVTGSVLVGRHAWRSSGPSNHQITSEATRAVLLDEASTATAKVLSYHAATFGKDSTAAEALMTASMKAQYLKTLDKVRSKVSTYGLNLTAQVVAIGLISATSQEVRALAFVNQATTAKHSKNTQVDQVRAVVTMQHTASGWRISDIKPF